MGKQRNLFLIFSLGLGWTLALLWALADQPSALASGLLRPRATEHTVGGACGASIQACIDAAAAGDTVHIPAGTYTESLLLNKAVSLTGINSATTIIQALPDQRVLLVSGSAVDSAVVISGFTVTGGNPSSDGGGGIVIIEGAAPRLENLIITHNQTAGAGGGLCASPGSTCGFGLDALERPLYLTNVDFISNTAHAGGGASLQAQVVVVGGRFVDNVATVGNGGGIYVHVYNSVTNTHLDQGLRVQGTAFLGNTAAYGAGAYVAGPASVSNARFEANDAAGAGGGLYISGPVLSVDDTSFVRNKTRFGGGGLNTESERVTIRNSRFIGNDAADSRGGGGVHSYHHTVIADSLFEDNRGAEGGALFVNTSATISHTDFIRNQATVSSGGAIVAGSVTVTGGQFVDNQSDGSGGAIFASNPSLVDDTVMVSDAHFLRNQAQGPGGAIRSQGAITVTGSIFESNHSQQGWGGAIDTNGEPLTLIDTQVLSNTAGTAGGGAYAGNVLMVGSRFQGNRAGVSDGTFGEGGGLSAYGALVISGTAFIDNHATGNGAGAILYTGDTTTTITNGLFRGNVTGKSGGGLFLGGYGAVVLIDTDVDGNEAEENGGGMFVPSGGTQVILQGVRVSGNQAQKDGGGVHGSASLLMEESEFVGNRAGENGGGLYSYNGYLGEAYGTPYKIRNSRFEGNVAAAWGGGLYAMGWETYEQRQISNTHFIDNFAGAQGGGASLEKAIVVGSRFEGNHSDGDAGGLDISAWKSTSWVSDTLFVDNSGGGSGGAVLVGFGETILSGLQFLANRAHRGGGLAYLGSLHIATHLSLENALFARNTVTDTGAALYIGDGYHDLRHLTLADSALNPRPALYFEPVCWRLSGCTSLNFHNNIIANHAVGIHVASVESDDHAPFFDIDYNLYADNTKLISATNVVPGPNSLRGNADFVNPANDDYHLGAASDARDRAGAAHCPAADLEGNQRPQGAACDIGAYEGAPTTPAIALTPTAFSFIAMQGVGQPEPQPLHIENVAVGSLSWTTSADQTWLNVSPSGGSGNQATVNIGVNQSGMAPGVYNGTVSVGGNASNSPQTAAVALEVLDGCSALVGNGGFEEGNTLWQVSTNQNGALIRSAAEMGEYGAPHNGAYAVVLGWADGQTNELSQEIKLPSGTPLALTYYYQIDTDESSCAEDKVEVRLGDGVIAEHALCQANNTNGWTQANVDIDAYANRSATLSFHLQNGALGFPSVFLLDDVAIPVTSSVNCGVSSLQVAPASLSFSAKDSNDTPVGQSLTINNSGAAVLNWSASTQAQWLYLDSTEGTTPATVNVTVYPSGLSNGTHTEQITISSPGASGSPKVIDVVLVIGSPSTATPTPTTTPTPTATATPPGSTGTPTSTATPTSVNTATTTPTPTATNTATVTPTPTSTNTPVTGQIDSGGGSVSSGDNAVQVTFPAGAVDGSTTVEIITHQQPPQTTDGYTFAGKAFDIEAKTSNGQPVTQFNQPFTLTVHYSDNDWQNAGIADESDLNLYWWGGSDWQAILPCAGCSHDTTANRIVAVLDHLTEFAVMRKSEMMSIYLPSVVR
jgi:predicted outer membrane repeat protein